MTKCRSFSHSCTEILGTRRIGRATRHEKGSEGTRWLCVYGLVDVRSAKSGSAATRIRRCRPAATDGGVWRASREAGCDGYPGSGAVRRCLRVLAAVTVLPCCTPGDAARGGAFFADQV